MPRNLKLWMAVVNWAVAPPKDMFRSWPPSTCECDFIWEKGLWHNLGSQDKIIVDLQRAKSNDRCPYQKSRGIFERQRGTAIWVIVTTSQGTAGATRAGRGKEGFSLEPVEGAWSCQHLVSDFWTPELRDNKFPFVLSSQIYGNLLQYPWETDIMGNSLYLLISCGQQFPRLQESREYFQWASWCFPRKVLPSRDAQCGEGGT